MNAKRYKEYRIDTWENYSYNVKHKTFLRPKKEKNAFMRTYICIVRLFI